MNNFFLFFLLLTTGLVFSQETYHNVPRVYNIEVEIENDTVAFSYIIEFLETDSTETAYFETTSLDTFKQLMKIDLAALPETKNDLLFFFHGMMGGQKINNHFVKRDLVKHLIVPELSDMARLIAVRWPANTPIYKANKANAYKIAPALSNLVVELINEVRKDDQLVGVEINSLNHSLGTELFKEVVCEFEDKSIRYFDQILISASDLDIDVFVKNGPLQCLATIGNRTTVYHSNKDLTLSFSRELNKKGRLGLDGPHLETVFADWLVFVEMSLVTDERMLPMKLTGHSYYRASRLAAFDMLRTLVGKPDNLILRRELVDEDKNMFRIVPPQEN